MVSIWGSLISSVVPTYPKTQEEKKQDRKSKESDTNYMIWYHKCLHIYPERFNSDGE